MADIGQAVAAINALIVALGIPEGEQAAYRDMLFKMGNVTGLTFRYDMRPPAKLNGYTEEQFAEMVTDTAFTGPVSWVDLTVMAGGEPASKDRAKVMRIGKKAVEHGLVSRLELTPTKRGSIVLLPRE